MMVSLPEDSGWHLVDHVLVENVTLLLREYVENSNRAVTATSGDVLVIVVKSNAVGWG